MSGRIERNMGRVELYAVLEAVRTLQEAGYDYKKIHARLADSGQVTMSYSTFCFQMKKLAERQSQPKPTPTVPQPSPSRITQSEQRTSSNKAPGGVVRQGRDVPFNVNKSPDLKDFV